MSHDENLETIKSYLTNSYTREETRVVPKRSDLTFGNTLKQMPHAVVMYVDMRGSQKLLSKTTAFVSVKVHRSFLQSIVYCVENRDGHFRSFNGDGALSFFVGENAASRADLVWVGTPVYVAVELSDLAGHPNHIWISRHVRKSIGKQEYRPNAVNHNGKSIWRRTTKKLKSVGQTEPRYTSYYSTIF